MIELSGEEHAVETLENSVPQGYRHCLREMNGSHNGAPIKTERARSGCLDKIESFQMSASYFDAAAARANCRDWGYRERT